MDGGFDLFETRLGLCGIAWSGSLVRGLQFPGADEACAIARLEQRFPDLSRAEAVGSAEIAVGAVTRFLGGDIGTDLRAIELDLGRVNDWERQVYITAREIPVGQTVTYGSLAERVGGSSLARAVGQALGRNPWPIIIPCHRVTASGGAMGGFSAPGGRVTKMNLLEIEGALGPDTLPLFGTPRI